MADTDFGQNSKDTSSSPEEITQIGPYKIEILLQRSGMSLLYLATDTQLHTPAAVKVLLPKLAEHKDVVEHFLREARIMSLADHPNIVKMYSHGIWDGSFYIAMEFIMGGSLRQYLLQNPLSLKRSLEIILEISYAICHLHTHGIIHRDLKLENILITDEGRVKLIDFGIAQLLDNVKHEERGVYRYRTMGTPIYMSPEQRENPDAVSYASDIYSLGIIAYELVLGKLSQGHVHLSLMPKGLQKILAQALQPEMDKRYQDIVDFITDISAYLSSQDLEKERKVGDRTSELFDSLQLARKILLPTQAPCWPLLEVGLAANVTKVEAGLYGDFIETENSTYVIAFGSSLAVDAESVIFSASMRGMMRSLMDKYSTLKELIETLNAILLNDSNGEGYALCCLRISLSQRQLSFISCGYGALWCISGTEEIPRRILNVNSHLRASKVDFHETVYKIEPKDQFLLYGANQCLPETEALLLQGIVEFRNMPLQNKTEGIMRKIKLFNPKGQAHSFVVTIISQRQ